MVLGIFIAQLDDAYQRGLWKGITARAQERGHGIIGFVGQRLDAPAAAEATRNIAYRLADKENIDGLIAFSSTIGTFRGIAGVRSLLEGIDVPRISVGVRVPGIRGVTVDGRTAMAELVRHLILRDGRRRIALLAGPEGHSEADERERAFRDELTAAGLPFDDRLFVRGSFLSDSGAAGARTLLSRNLDFDCLVCLNDSMAMGAMAVLREAGVRIPTDVAVTGFDDIPEARWASPPLTTVAQPLEELGRNAVDMILELLEGGEVEERVLASTLVTRQSCGCPPARRTSPDGTGTEDGGRQEAPVNAELLACLRSGGEGAFLRTLNEALLASTPHVRCHAGDDSADILDRWHRVLEGISAEFEGKRTLYGEAQALVSSMEIHEQAAARIEAYEQHQLIRSLSARLAGSFSMATMLVHLTWGLRRLGIHAGYLVLFSSDGAHPRRGRLRMVFPPPTHDGVDPDESAAFDTAFLLPGKYVPKLAEGTWILEPLVFQDEELGYLLLEGTDKDPTVFENLRDQVSSTLKGSLLMEKITGHEQELERVVMRRTRELQKANLELRALLVQRKTLEREVQEISDKTMQTIGQDLHDDLCQNLAGISMFVSVLESELRNDKPEQADSAARLRKMLEDSIARTRRIARGLYPPGLRERGLVAALEDLFDSVSQSGKVSIDLQADPAFPPLENARALQIFRIVQEAVSNSIRHSGTDRVIVRLKIQDRHACAEILDSGCGLDPFSLGSDDQGMGLRIMRYRAESIGAELTMEKLDPGLRIACRWEAETFQGGSHG